MKSILFLAISLFYSGAFALETCGEKSTIQFAQGFKIQKPFGNVFYKVYLAKDGPIHDCKIYAYDKEGRSKEASLEGVHNIIDNSHNVEFNKDDFETGFELTVDGRQLEGRLDCASRGSFYSQKKVVRNVVLKEDVVKLLGSDLASFDCKSKTLDKPDWPRFSGDAQGAN